VTRLGTPQPSPLSGRDPALDLLRSVALVRVVLWHAFAASWMTFFAAMPTLFFVAGVLLSASNDGRRHRDVLARRCRRLLPPFWLYGAVVGFAGAVYSRLSDESMKFSLATLWAAGSWVLPIVDPVASEWHGGWFSTHLWYLRTYLWILLLAPILAKFARDLRIAVPVFAGGVFVIDLAERWELASDSGIRVIAGDAFTYGFFVVLGMAYRNRRRDPDRRLLAVGAAGAALATAVHVMVAGLPAAGVNGSYPAVALTGAAWLFGIGAIERPVRQLAETPWVRRLTTAVNRRAVTIYLWHPAAIVAGYVALARWGGAVPSALRPLVVLIVAVGVTALVAVGVGWVEDFAAGRADRRTRRRRIGFASFVSPTAAGVALALPFAMVPIPSDEALASGGGRRPSLPPPSYRPALGDAAFPQASGGLRPVTIRLPGNRMPAAALQAELERWLEGQDGFDSVAVGVTVAGQTWVGEAHRDGVESRTHAQDSYGVASVTKTFTAALVLGEIANGRIRLDEPVPALPGVGRPPTGVTITPRQLLQHTSGLVDYGAAAGYDPGMALTPRAAVRLSLANPLQAKPGERVIYANSNYHYLGLLLEHATGRPYGELVGRLTKSLGLSDTKVDMGGGPGWTGFASGGVHSTVGDLARWGAALFTPGRVLPDEQVRRLTTVDEHNMAVGTWPLCPCRTDAQGRKHAAAFGQHSGHGGLYHFLAGLTLAVHMEPPTEGADAKTAALGAGFLRTLRSPVSETGG
jgi:CubicO group peptidase (beta-lactamase class C family)/peptidoglycan/LPS O-acetylase OafA/YrhL